MIYEPKLPITPLTACRLTWKGNNGRTFKYRRTGNPRLTISVSSYVNSCAFGAMHYYGRVKGDQPSVYCVEEDRHYLLGGHGSDKPELYGVFEFDAKRKLTTLEEDKSGELIGEVGDNTSRFNTPHEAFEAAVMAAIKNFKDTKTKHWVVNFEGCGDDLDCDRHDDDEMDGRFRLSDLENPELLSKFQWERYSL